MMCLSVRQPWAHLIVSGQKDCENRTWQTDYRGPLLIHASRTVEPFNVFPYEPIHLPPRCEWVLGGLIGRVEIVACSHAGADDMPTNVWHEPGMWGWYFQDALQFAEPIPYRGSPKLFEVPDKVVAKQLPSDLQTQGWMRVIRQVGGINDGS